MKTESFVLLTLIIFWLQTVTAGKSREDAVSIVTLCRYKNKKKTRHKMYLYVCVYLNDSLNLQVICWFIKLGGPYGMYVWIPVADPTGESSRRMSPGTIFEFHTVFRNLATNRDHWRLILYPSLNIELKCDHLSWYIINTLTETSYSKYSIVRL